MKKQNFKSLRLNKKSISHLRQDTVKGGSFICGSISCQPEGICLESGEPGCPSFGCLTDGCPPQTTNCPGSISCDDVGICGQ
jgi:hypothetical protein